MQGGCYGGQTPLGAGCPGRAYFCLYSVGSEEEMRAGWRTAPEQVFSLGRHASVAFAFFHGFERYCAVQQSAP